MKKWPIFAAALLFALAGGFKFLQHKGPGGNAGSASGPRPPLNVPLPGGDMQYAIPPEFSAVPRQSGPPSTYGALPTIKKEIYDKGSCKGGSLNEILSSHGRIWGYMAPYGAFRSQETSAVYDLIGRYLSCVGLARGAPSFCDYLPGERPDVPLRDSPNYKCREYYLEVSTRPGPAEACPADRRGLCTAFFSKSEASCSAMLVKLSASYCGYLAKAQKRANGYAGFSPAEVKEALKIAEGRKAEEERLRLENQRITEDINNRVRRMTGKP